jgi:hypothetical protein
VVSSAETIGADPYIHFMMDAPLLLAEDPQDAAEPVDGTWLAERVNRWTARISGAVVGEAVEVVMAPGRLHAFDPRSGRSISK